MVRIAKALGLVILCVAVLILSLISYVSLRKDSLFASSNFIGGPRIMFHAGFRWVVFVDVMQIIIVGVKYKHWGLVLTIQPECDALTSTPHHFPFNLVKNTFCQSDSELSEVLMLFPWAMHVVIYSEVKYLHCKRLHHQQLHILCSKVLLLNYCARGLFWVTCTSFVCLFIV